MNYKFFADEEDKLSLLRYILSETDLRIYELYSDYSQEIREYKSLESLTSRFNFQEGGQFAVCFQLWSPACGGEVYIEKITLNPKSCKGHTFRFSTNGWGLIQLYFGGIEGDELNYSHIGHFNEKGALSREADGAKSGKTKVNEWNWKEIRKYSHRLKYQIHQKMAVDKVGSMGVLLGAARLMKEGKIDTWYGKQ